MITLYKCFCYPLLAHILSLIYILSGQNTTPHIFKFRNFTIIFLKAVRFGNLFSSEHLNINVLASKYTALNLITFSSWKRIIISRTFKFH